MIITALAFGLSNLSRSLDFVKVSFHFLFPDARFAIALKALFAHFSSLKLAKLAFNRTYKRSTL